MDELLPRLLSFPPHPPRPTPMSDHLYDESIKEQIEAVKKIQQSKLLLQTSGGEHVLDVINPALNTVPYVFILMANISALSKQPKGVNMDTLWAKMVGFLESFDSRQIRYLGDELDEIIQTVAGIAMNNDQPWLAVAPIRNAILRVDPSGSILTSRHLLLVKLALESQNRNNAYLNAVPVLDKYILYFPGATNQPKPKHVSDMSLSPASYITPASKLTEKLKPLDVLEYFFYSGMVYIGLRSWDSALQCLENAVTYPSERDGVSKVMVEAYKKWVLVSILLDGRLLSLPKSTSSNAAKQYHILAKPYETLAQIFETGTAARLKAEADIGHILWQNDCNTGLVLNVLSAFQKFQIRNLANVYSKISIPEILSQTHSAETGAKLSSPQQLESLIQGMIAQGELHATMSSSPNGPSILTFSPSGPVLSEVQIQRELAASTERIQALTKEIKLTDRMLTHDKEYIKFVQKQRKNAKQGSGDQGIAVMDMDYNDAIEDEDIMAYV